MAKIRKQSMFRQSLPAIFAGGGLVAVIIAVQVFNSKLDLVQSPYRDAFMPEPGRGIASISPDGMLAPDNANDRDLLRFMADTTYRPTAFAGHKPSIMEDVVFGKLADSFVIRFKDEKIVELNATSDNKKWSEQDMRRLMRRHPEAFAEGKVSFTVSKSGYLSEMQIITK